MNKTPHITGIDFETYSEADLGNVGSWNYSKHPSTEVLWLAIKTENGSYRKLKDLASIKNQIRVLLEYCRSGEVVISGWNIQFEICIIANTLGFGIENLDMNWFDDTMAMAGAMALPQKLETCGIALGVPEEKQKMETGKELMKQLSSPLKASAKKWIEELMFLPHIHKIRRDTKGNFIYRNTNPDLMEDYGDYCIGDVKAENYIRSRLRPLIPVERKVWVQTMENNFKGLNVDLKLCKHAIRMFIKQKNIELGKIQKETGLANPNSRDQVMEWLEEQGWPLPNLQKETIEEAITSPAMPEYVKTVLTLRGTSAKSPPSKYATMVTRTDPEDSKFRGAIWYHRATTGREGSVGINMQNLYRPEFDDVEGACEWIMQEMYRELAMVYGSVMGALSSCVRGAVVPSTGRRLLAVDYSAVEGRTLAWLAGEVSKLKIYRTTGLAYEAAASQIYQVAMDAVTKPQRFVGKTAELASGYQGSYRAFIRMAARHGVDFESYKPDGWKMPKKWFSRFWDRDSYPNGAPYAVWFADDVVSKWRKVSPRTVELWADMQECAHLAVENPGTLQIVNDKLAFKTVKIKDVKYLFMRLPSGRSICYPYPHFGNGKYGRQLQYFSTHPTSGRWVKMSTYGGDLTQSATQATARDVFLHSNLKLRGTCYEDIALKIHDEGLYDVPYGQGSIDELGSILCEGFDWSKGLPLNFDGQELTRFKKT